MFTYVTIQFGSKESIYYSIDTRCLQLSILMGQICSSSGYFCSFIGHDRTAEILQSHPLQQTLQQTTTTQAREVYSVTRVSNRLRILVTDYCVWFSGHHLFRSNKTCPNVCPSVR